MEKVSGLVVAGGVGARMGRDTPKQFLLLGGRPIFIHALLTLAAESILDSITLVVNPGRIGEYNRLINEYGISQVKKLVPGGTTRQESVYNGLSSISPTQIVVIHDAVRPLVTSAVIQAAIAGAREFGAAGAAIPAVDTLIEADDNRRGVAIPERTRLYRCQTPQAFNYELIRAAHEEAKAAGITNASDDLALILRQGRPVKLTLGSPENLKITTPQDLLFAEAILKARQI